MKIWVTTDTHLHHDEMVEFAGRPADHTELILRNWAKAVRPDDITIHLGDVTWRPNLLKEELATIPGRKILVMGNHDEKPAEWYMKNGFDFATTLFSLVYKGQGLVFTHIPLEGQSLIAQGALNLCGHLHNNDHRAHGFIISHYHRLLALEGEKQQGQECWANLLNYKPILLDKAI